MASGYFPLYKNDSDGKKLIEAIRLLKEVASEISEASSVSCTPEDAVRDGEYISDLYRAASLIAPCIEGHMTHRGCIVKVHHILNRYLPPDSDLSAHDAISEILGVLDGPDWRSAEGEV